MEPRSCGISRRNGQYELKGMPSLAFSSLPLFGGAQMWLLSGLSKTAVLRPLSGCYPLSLMPVSLGIGAYRALTIAQGVKSSR